MVDYASKNYYDWFGSGNTVDDVNSAIQIHGVPKKIYYQKDGYVAVLIFENKAVVVGYDNAEYEVNFVVDVPE